MALDFPNSPITGVTYTGPNGVIWVYDGQKWVNGTTVGTAYAPIASPVFTGNPTAPNPPVADNDTSLATTQFVQSTVAPAFNGVGRNLIHNPMFAVAQRGAGPWTVSGAYTLDRWTLILNLDTASVTRGTSVDSDRTQIGDEAATFSLTNTFTGNAGAAAYNFILQRTEDVRRLAGKIVTISFWAVASTGTLKLGVSLDQVFGSGGSPSAQVSVPGTAVALSTGWVRRSVTFTVPSAVGKTIGTNGDSYTSLNFWYSCGATYAASAGNIGVQSGTIAIWGVQLEVGSVATILEKPDPRYDLSNCSRFYQKHYGLQNYVYGNATAGFSNGSILATTMRAPPTVTFSNITYANCSSLSMLVATASYVGWQWVCTVTGSHAPFFDMALSADL